MKIALNWFWIVGIYSASLCSQCLGKFKYLKIEMGTFSNCGIIFIHILLQTTFCERGLRTSSRLTRYRSSVRRIACATPNITNGYFTKRRDILWTFYCDPNYKLIGKTKIICKDGRFDDEIPVCASVCVGD